MRNVLLFSTHILNNYISSQIIKLYDDIKEYADVYVLFQADNGYECDIPMDIKVYPFTVDSLNALGYEPWAETIVPGSNHFPVLQFFKEHGGYDYYWNIEYDVMFSGNWKKLISWFEDKEEDFVTSHIETFSDRPTWEHWNDMELKDAKIITKDHYLKSFNPIYRISNKALAFVDVFLKKGNRGHHEVLLPTVLNFYGFTIKDLGGNGRFTYGIKDLFYISDGADTWYSDSSMRFRPLYHTDEAIVQNKLYHPIKETSGMYMLGVDIIVAYKDIVAKTEWLYDKTFELGGFAVDEAYILYMLKFLNAHKFSDILDLGCGQTTLILNQYVKYAHSKLLTIESDSQWIVKLENEHQNVNVRDNTRFYKTETNEASMYIALTCDLIRENRKFDLISVDGPYGFNCKFMSRLNILEIINNGLLADKFLIMVHDTNRLAEMNTVNACKSILKNYGVNYTEKILHFGKGTTIITNIDVLSVKL